MSSRHQSWMHARIGWKQLKPVLLAIAGLAVLFLLKEGAMRSYIGIVSRSELGWTRFDDPPPGATAYIGPFNSEGGYPNACTGCETLGFASGQDYWANQGVARDSIEFQRQLASGRICILPRKSKVTVLKDDGRGVFYKVGYQGGQWWVTHNDLWTPPPRRQLW